MKFRWWMPPVIGVGIVACANAMLIATSFRVRPQKTEDQPYAASAFEDARAGERAAFAERGWRLTPRLDGAGVTLELHAPGASPPASATVRLYRPDDQAADRSVVWPEPAVPLRLDLPRPGIWVVRALIRDQAGTVLAQDLRLDRP